MAENFNFNGYDICELLLVLNVITKTEAEERDDAEGWIFFKAREYFTTMQYLYSACCVTEESPPGGERAFRATKAFLQKMITLEYPGAVGPEDMAIFSVLLLMEDRWEFFGYCALLAPKMWS